MLRGLCITHEEERGKVYRNHLVVVDEKELKQKLDLNKDTWLIRALRRWLARLQNTSLFDR